LTKQEGGEEQHPYSNLDFLDAGSPNLTSCKIKTKEEVASRGKLARSPGGGKSPPRARGNHISEELLERVKAGMYVTLDQSFPNLQAHGHPKASTVLKRKK